MTWTPPTLETARLVLRAVTEADAEAIFAAASDPRVTEYTLFETHRTRDDTQTFLRSYAFPNYEQCVPDPFALALKDDPATLIGCLGGRWNTQANQCVEFGYWLAAPHWGKGPATEAARAVIPYLFEEMSPERVQAHCMAPNVSSARVLEKAGLTYEGTLRSAILRRGRFWDIRMYAILRNEWQAGRGKAATPPDGVRPLGSS
jgi:ribosomal-protein-alanine N-acetyltransferase